MAHAHKYIVLRHHCATSRVNMASGKKSALLSSLAAYGDDSEQDSDPDTDEQEAHGGLVSAGYGDDDAGRAEEGDERDSGNEESDENDGISEADDSDSAEPHEDSKDVITGEKKDPNELVAQFSEKVRNMSPEEIRIPPEPPGRCSTHLQEKIYKLYERKLHGDFDTNSHIQKKKEFRNPSIYEKLIQFCGIDELGTNYPKDMFDPHGWSEDSYYESLAKAQKIEMEKLEKAKKERTKIEFVTGTKKGTSTNAAAVTTNTTNTTSSDAQKRKSKWDSAVPVTLSQPALLTTTATLPGVVSVTTTASGTKTTVISAVGTILKKAKQ
ncbi:SAP30-binding protein [Pangasianodon hypophthalmus]|uniref:SAP30-binding protein n=1 Tax=Pangasianodon hypophthalmus TaxID=310915 RepID=UPI0023080179|nr:SAP30-binding protein [Pangasianodon hypophthalmus]